MHIRTLRVKLADIWWKKGSAWCAQTLSADLLRIRKNKLYLLWKKHKKVRKLLNYSGKCDKMQDSYQSVESESTIHSWHSLPLQAAEL